MNNEQLAALPNSRSTFTDGNVKALRGMAEIYKNPGYEHVEVHKSWIIGASAHIDALTARVAELEAAFDELHAKHMFEMGRLSQPPAVAVPDGYALVPVEPTRSMLDAAHVNFRKDVEIDPLLKTSYRAMIAAAPKPERGE